MGKTIFNGDIDKLIKETARATVEELRKGKMVNEKPLTAYQKTERILFKYNNFKQVIQDRKDEIEEIKKYGLAKTSGSVIPMPQDTGFKEVKMESDKEEEVIKALERSIINTKKIVRFVDISLKSIKKDPYFKIIDLLYFQGKTQTEIAEHFNCDVSTINRNKSRLVNKLSIYLFSDDVVNEMYR